MRYVRNLIPLFLILVAPLAASAAVYGEKVDDQFLDDYRVTTDNGEVVGADLVTELFYRDNDPDLKIEWVIGDNGNGTWNYKYVLSRQDPGGPSAAPLNAISHFTLDISSEDAFDDISGEKMSIDYTTGTEDISDPALVYGDGSVGQQEGLESAWADSALKFEVGIGDGTVTKVTYQFDSNRQAVWGNVFVKAGQANISRGGWIVYNSGIGLENESESIANFIAVPDSVIVPNTEIPEPATMLVWSLLGLIGVGLIRRRR